MNKILRSYYSVAMTRLTVSSRWGGDNAARRGMQLESKVSFGVVVTDVLHHLSDEGKLGGGQ